MATIAMLPSAAAPFPSSEDIDLANYKAGSLISDIDEFERMIRAVKISEDPDGIPSVDADALAHLIVFAIDVRRDADLIRDYATRLLDHALCVYHEKGNETAAEHWQRVRRWHAEEATNHG